MDLWRGNEMKSAKQRLKILQQHIGNKGEYTALCSRPTSSSTSGHVAARLVQISPPPIGCEQEHQVLLTPEAVTFVAELVSHFNDKVDKMLQERVLKKLQLEMSGNRPDFLPETRAVRESDWKVKPLPSRLCCRHVDLGDVSPSNTIHFKAALSSTAQGIQTDFDDGHCPSWRNQLVGLYNVYAAVHSKLPGVPDIERAPVLMLRPRAWNMVEHNMMVEGREVPGPLFDFGLLMYHNARVLAQTESGPFFYLSKVESYKEARLWNDIFVWAQNKLGLAQGTIKACVLIENVLAVFETHEILYELRDHSLGLNCGIWDYSASFVNKFGTRKDFLIPDRSKYVSMERHFLKSYMDLVIKTCHQRGTHATGGMAALLLPSDDEQRRQEVIEKVVRGKLREIKAGADGFMVYDLGLLQPMQQLFMRIAPSPNQWHVLRHDARIKPADLLQMPEGGVTYEGLKHNIAVGVLFIYFWLKGKGHYYYKGAVEDSATAEISRSQVWQWLRHGASLEESREVITVSMVRSLIRETVLQSFTSPDVNTQTDKRKLVKAAGIFEQIVTKRDFPEFITTYLNLDDAWVADHCFSVFHY